MYVYDCTEEGVSSAQRCSEALYGGSPQHLAELSEKELRELFSNATCTELYYEPGTTVYDLVMAAKCFNRPGTRILTKIPCSAY